MTQKQIETRKNNLKNFDSEVQRNRRIRQLQTEESLANTLRKDGWEIYSPTVVCDRIGIKTNKVYFIEFKKNGQILRPGQKRVKDILSDDYKIVYY